VNTPERVLTLSELNRATLARQMLLGRENASAHGAVERPVGLQAQVTSLPTSACGPASGASPREPRAAHGGWCITSGTTRSEEMLSGKDLIERGWQRGRMIGLALEAAERLGAAGMDDDAVLRELEKVKAASDSVPDEALEPLAREMART
jgi:hypothetical protein